MNNPLEPRPAVIKEIRSETYDTVTYTFSFTDPEEQARYRYLPGQFNMLGLWGYGEAAFTLTSDPHLKNGTFDHTIRIVGDVTRALSGLKVGDKVDLRGPYGTCWPLDEAMGKHVLVVAGGTGLAPLRPVLEHVLARRNQYGALTILYGARTPRDLLFERDFQRWSDAPDTRLLLTVDRTDGETWSQTVGVVPVLFEQAPPSPEHTIALVCGPEVMMRFVIVDLMKRGFGAEQIYLSLERRMRCGIAMCGHCFFGHKFVCRDGPVFSYENIRGLWSVKGV
ncbi:MAG: hypothetical protein EPO21_12605 [Chloroflexota bacterium]|nr:MAG: hypothetical protein EPO21_12605 [Chloroflexota bacterium]